MTPRPHHRPARIGRKHIQVPFRGQGDPKNPRALWSQICSPTSTSMVMEYYGINRIDAGKRRRDLRPRLRHVRQLGLAPYSRAGEMGLDAWLEQLPKTGIR